MKRRARRRCARNRYNYEHTITDVCSARSIRRGGRGVDRIVTYNVRVIIEATTRYGPFRD